MEKKKHISLRDCEKQQTVALIAYFLVKNLKKYPNMSELVTILYTDSSVSLTIYIRKLHTDSLSNEDDNIL